MVPLMSLWMPIILAAVGVFIVSSIIHMVLRYHNSDVERLPGEDEVMAALRGANAGPGDYMFPYGGSMAAMNDPKWIEKYKLGPAGVLTILPPLRTERPSMTSNLVQWFIFCVVVSLFAAYLTSRALPPGAGFASVLRFGGTAAFMGYALGLFQQSIWWNRKWSSTLKSAFDGLLFGLVTGAIFAWMWPMA